MIDSGKRGMSDEREEVRRYQEKARRNPSGDRTSGSAARGDLLKRPRVLGRDPASRKVEKTW